LVDHSLALVLRFEINAVLFDSVEVIYRQKVWKECFSPLHRLILTILSRNFRVTNYTLGKTELDFVVMGFFPPLKNVIVVFVCICRQFYTDFLVLLTCKKL
jgi:hypothetical protein